MKDLPQKGKSYITGNTLSDRKTVTSNDFLMAKYSIHYTSSFYTPTSTTMKDSNQYMKVTQSGNIYVELFKNAVLNTQSASPNLINRELLLNTCNSL